MRIIAGSAGGITIKVPDSVARPTTDRVREALFSMLGDAVENARVLDLYAGSGALGLEALSRGAREAVFIEQNSQACAIISDNIKRSRLSAGRVMKGEVTSTLRRLAQSGEHFDLIFADPPYAKKPGDTDHGKVLLNSDSLRNLLAPDGWFMLETMVTKRADDAMPQWTVVRDRAYGSTRILILQPMTNDATISGAANLQSPLPICPAGDGTVSVAQDEAARRHLG
jgi:16S rRNA (guanine966-N2)-methyltransferase